ncbi:MAG: hypothetical protein ACREI9_13660 [Nitrospiraceae bacterium]
MEIAWTRIQNLQIVPGEKGNAPPYRVTTFSNGNSVLATSSVGRRLSSSFRP